MTLAHFWSWQTWTLLGLNLAAESAVLWLAISRRFFRRLVMLPIFAGFCLAFDIGTLILGCTLTADAANGSMWYSHAYWLFYWAGQFGASAVLLLLALQVVTVILPPWDRLISILVIVLCLALAVAYLKLLPIEHPRDVLTLLTWASAITILALPIIGVVHSDEWPKGIPLVVAGMVLSLVIQVACAVTAAILKTMVGFVSLGVPLAALVGMGFFLAALIRMPEVARDQATA